MMNVTRERVERDIQRVLDRMGQLRTATELDAAYSTLNALEDILADIDGQITHETEIIHETVWERGGR